MASQGRKINDDNKRVFKKTLNALHPELYRLPPVLDGLLSCLYGLPWELDRLPRVLNGFPCVLDRFPWCLDGLPSVLDAFPPELFHGARQLQRQHLRFTQPGLDTSSRER